MKKRKKNIRINRTPADIVENEQTIESAKTVIPVQPGQMGEESDQSTELNLSPSDIVEAGFGEFVDDEWRMDADFKEDLVRTRDTNLKKETPARKRKPSGK